MQIHKAMPMDMQVGPPLFDLKILQHCEYAGPRCCEIHNVAKHALRVLARLRGYVDLTTTPTT